MRVDASPDLDLRHWRVVASLARWRSFKAAALALQMSQPALTRSLQQTERALGLALFERTTRRVTITRHGREFAALAERLLADLRHGVDALRAGEEHVGAPVMVSSVHTLAEAWTPTARRAMERRFPGVAVHLREGLQSDVIHDVETGLADFGIGYIDGAPAVLSTAPLAAEQLLVVMPVRHPLCARAQVDLRMLRDATWVSFPAESRTRRIVDGAAAAAGFTPRYVMTTNRLATLLALARHGVGLAVVPGSEWSRADTRGLVARPLAGLRGTYRLGVLRLRERELGAAASAVLALIRASQRGA